MTSKRFKPMTDKMFFGILIPTLVLLVGCTALAFPAPSALFVILPTDLFVIYFLLSPLFGYVEVRDDTVFIKLGFFMKREIPYAKIRGTSVERKFYADSMLSLKTALSHVNIKYNTFDVISVSVCDADELIRELEKRKRAAVERLTEAKNERI